MENKTIGIIKVIEYKSLEEYIKNNPKGSIAKKQLRTQKEVQNEKDNNN